MNKFDPKDSAFRERVKSSFDRQQCMATLGIEISKIEPGMIELIMPYSKPYTQQHGFIHAGIISTALDSACGYAAFSLMPVEAAVLTIEYKINLLAPAMGEDFIFRAAVVKPGRVLFEIAGVPEDTAREAMRLASHKLPIKTQFVMRAGVEEG